MKNFALTLIAICAATGASACIDAGWTPIPGTQNACHYTGVLVGTEVFAQRTGDGTASQDPNVIENSAGDVVRDDRDSPLEERRVKVIN